MDGEKLMTFIKVRWLHSLPTEPVELYSELDASRWELRKVEVFADGAITYADQTQQTGTTGLGLVPPPPLLEIAKNPAFVPIEIDNTEFERVWRLAANTRLEK